MDIIEQLIFLKKVPIFEYLTIEELGIIANFTKVDVYEEGEILFLEGDIGDTAYVIISGKIEIYRDIKNSETKFVDILQKGDCFGEMSVFDEEPRSASARAIEQTSLCIYTKDSLEEAIRNFPNIALGIIKVLSKRLRNYTISK